MASDVCRGWARVPRRVAGCAVNTGSPALADELGRPPAVLSISQDAKPIEHAKREAPETRSNGGVKQSSAQWSTDGASAESESSNAWKLRWRKSTHVMPTTAKEPRPLAVSRAVVWNQTNLQASSRPSAVRTVAQFTPTDPFEEPYPGQNRGSSERSSPARNGTFNTEQQQPAEPESLPSDEPKPMPSDALLPPESTVPMPERDPAPTPPGDPAPAPPGDPAPAPLRDLNGADRQLEPIPEDMPCERNYNERNCCVDDAKCLQAQQHVTQYKITNILLDITPSFTNTETSTSPTFVPTEVQKQMALAKAPSRTWKNRAGQTVAEGRFADYHNGLVHVLGSSGETVELAFNELSNDDVCFVTAWWSLPSECSLAEDAYQPRNWLASTLTWKASALCHKPLYFEEVALERYGHSVGPLKQPFVSGAHFFGSLAALPYQMGIHPPNECQYALGYYRPGSCAPWLVPPFPVSLRGALAEVGAWVGGIYIIP